MLIIIVTVVTQGVRTPVDLKGSLEGSLLIRPGVTQAIGVISFGNIQSLHRVLEVSLTVASVCLPFVMSFDLLRVTELTLRQDHNSLLIYGSLKKPTLDRFAKVTHYSTSISMVACLIMALGGFLTFGDKTLGNVLNNFPTDNIMVNVARLYVETQPEGFHR